VFLLGGWTTWHYIGENADAFLSPVLPPHPVSVLCQTVCARPAEAPLHEGGETNRHPQEAPGGSTSSRGEGGRG